MELAFLEILKIFVLASIFFVWVVRYSSIIEEFKLFGYPQWLRDFVGIQKIAFSLMLFNQDVFIVKFGALGISLLMLCALLTHFKIKNPFPKMLPSSLLLISNVIIFFKS